MTEVMDDLIVKVEEKPSSDADNSSKNKKMSQSGITQDNIYEYITHNLNSNKTLFPSQVTIEEIIGNMDVLIVISSYDHQEIHHITPNFEKIFGLLFEDFINDKALFTKRIHPLDFNKITRIYNISQRELIRELDFRYLLNNGQWGYFNVYRFPLYDEEGNECQIASIIIDNTKLYNLQEKLHLEKNIIIKQNKKLIKINELLENFTAFACHDLVQPLRIANNYTQLLEGKHLQNMDEEGKQIFSSIYAANNRMKNLIEDIKSLFLIRDESTKNPLIDPKKLIEEIIKPLYTSSVSPLCTLELKELHPLSIKEEHFIIILENIIENSIKYNNIFPHIKIHSKIFKTGVVYVITDNGIGIPIESQEEIFKLGKRLSIKSDLPGTGIGLWACKKIMALYGGEIWVHSQIHKGSNFYIFIPHAS